MSVVSRGEPEDWMRCRFVPLRPTLAAQILREEARSAADPLGNASHRHLTPPPVPSFGEHLSSTVDTAGAVDTAANGAVSTSTAPPMSTGVSFAAEGRRSPVGTSSTATAGVPAGLPASPIKSVSSAGGDRLQQLAMAEVGYSHKGLYAPKTGETGIG